MADIKAPLPRLVVQLFQPICGVAARFSNFRACAFTASSSPAGISSVLMMFMVVLSAGLLLE
ncbi:hypothetical protein INH39_08275 [Massilia violaceinigra]|uniref:Uncharacterized protein n=1 Tax=Massilia violaceinigra TaxID=2045208 RepID=A0ABY4ABV9_9BURK|nr:hypothetical protein [Massilia violaceinigra]UOD31665.1 hypothetical protein INH39_08275 [Massilia violaceinigra]